MGGLPVGGVGRGAAKVLGGTAAVVAVLGALCSLAVRERGEEARSGCWVGGAAVADLVVGDEVGALGLAQRAGASLVGKDERARMAQLVFGMEREILVPAAVAVAEALGRLPEGRVAKETTGAAKPRVSGGCVARMAAVFAVDPVVPWHVEPPCSGVH